MDMKVNRLKAICGSYRTKIVSKWPFLQDNVILLGHGGASVADWCDEPWHCQL